MNSLPLQDFCNAVDFTNLIANLHTSFYPPDIKTENILEPYISPLSPVPINITKADFYLNF